MTKLMQEILKDPAAVFEIGAKLPSGNEMSGTVGPMIGGKIHCSIHFSVNPASPQDVEYATQAMNVVLGQDHAMAIVSNSEKERGEALKKVRQFFGGGQG